MVLDKDFRGTAYIVKNKEVLLNYSGGFADLANEIPNTIETRFASASMSKTFVAVGILKLIEDYVYMQGCDDGISAISEYNPNSGMITVMLSNYGDNVWSRMRKIRGEMY